MKIFYNRIKYRILLYFPFVIIKQIFKKGNSLKTPHFFILGSGRNGSTLLATVLNAHKDIVIPPEQFVLPYAILRRYLFFFWSFKSWINNVKKLFLTKDKTTKWNLNLDNLSSQDNSIASLFNEIFTSYKNSKNPNAKYWGDKSPINTNFIKYIYPEFPTAKYIFLIRDPRDVMLSYKKFKGDKSAYQAFSLWKWNDSVKTLEYLQKRTNVLIVRYEDFVLDSEIELKKIQSFLDIKISDNLSTIKKSISTMGVSDMDHHQNLNNPISASSVDKWKTQLPAKDLLHFNKHIKNKMLQFGYKFN